MKLLHTGDLHIGKTVHEVSMLSDQRYILQQIADIAVKEQVDALVIAGDVYDRSIPSTDAVNILDEFLSLISEKKIPIFMISGNHDSAERVEFANRILEKQEVYIAGEGIKQVTLKDNLGEVTFVLLPFVKPAIVDSKNSMEAVEKMLSQVPIQKKNEHRYILVTHFFVTGKGGTMPELSDSENLVQVGGLDNVEATIFKDYDYVALGHIHKPQQIGESAVYYAGSPLKYSFSEVNQTKCVNIVTLEKEVKVERIPLQPRHEMRKIKGTLQALLQTEIVDAADREDYIQATLTDTEELIDPIGALRSVYPNVMQIIMQKNEVHEETEYESKVSTKRASTFDLFGDFYELIKGESLDEKRMEIVKEAIEWAEEKGKGET